MAKLKSMYIIILLGTTVRIRRMKLKPKDLLKIMKQLYESFGSYL